jgi:hypothetical protein
MKKIFLLYRQKCIYLDINVYINYYINFISKNKINLLILKFYYFLSTSTSYFKITFFVSVFLIFLHENVQTLVSHRN